MSETEPITLWVVMEDVGDEDPTLRGAYRSEEAADTACGAADYCTTVRPVTVFGDDELPVRAACWYGGVSIREDGTVEPFQAGRPGTIVLWPGETLKPTATERKSALLVSGAAMVKWRLSLSNQSSLEAATAVAAEWLDAKRAELGLTDG